MSVVRLEGWKTPISLQQDAPFRLTQDHSPNNLKLGLSIQLVSIRTNWRLYTAKLHPDIITQAISYLKRGEDHSCFFHLFCWISCAEQQLTHYQLCNLWNTELSRMSKKSLVKDAGPVWVHNHSAAELQKAPCRGHAPSAALASPGSLLVPVTRSRQHHQPEHVL